MNKLLKLSILISVITLSACDKNKDIYSTIHIPIIKECKEVLINHLNNEMWSHDLKWEILEYKGVVSYMHYPNIIGTLTLHGVNKGMTEERLISYTNGAILDCYPTTSAEIPLEKMGSDFIKEFNIIDKYYKPTHKYITVDNDKVSIYFNSPIN